MDPSQFSKNDVPVSASNRKAVPLLLLLISLGAAAMVALWNAFPAPSAETTTAQNNATTMQVTPTAPGARPFAGRGPDPKFVRLLPPDLSPDLSPESRSMVLAMQNTYRCMHCGGRTTQPRCLPQLKEGDEQDVKAVLVAMRQGLGLLPDSCYVSTALTRITDPRTPPELMNVLYQDLQKRPNPIKLRTLFILASLESHPLAGIARGGLREAMKLDHQDDWARWQKAIVAQVSHEERGMRPENCRMH